MTGPFCSGAGEECVIQLMLLPLYSHNVVQIATRKPGYPGI